MIRPLGSMGRIDVYDLVRIIHGTSIESGAATSDGGAFGLAISPDGATVYVGVIDAATRTIARTIDSCGRTPVSKCSR